MIKMEKNDEINSSFWMAPDTALFSQKAVSLVICKSEAWLEWKRHSGDGIPFRKIGRRCLYQKSDVVAFINKHQIVHSTSEYDIATM